jgi:hypothetical protein
LSHLYGGRFTLMSVVLKRMLVLEPPRASRQSSGNLGVVTWVGEQIKCRRDYTLRSLPVVRWDGICAPVRSNQACLIPVNTLIFDHKLSSPEERIVPFSYFNKVPVG